MDEKELSRIRRLIREFLDSLPQDEAAASYDLAMQYVGWNIYNALHGDTQGLEAMVKQEDNT